VVGPRGTTAATNQGFNDNPVGLVFQKHAKMYQYENIIIQKNRGFIAYSAIKMPNKPPRRNPLRTSAKLSPMIGKFLL